MWRCWRITSTLVLPSTTDWTGDLYFLRKLRVCWGSSIGASNTNRLNKLLMKAGSVIGCKQDTLEAVMERRTMKKTVIHHG